MTGTLRWLERRGQDIRYAARVVRRRPGFGLAAAVTLALGLGANTAVFSILHGLLFESLPVYRPHELARLVEPRRQSTTPYEAFTYSTFELLRRNSHMFSGIAAASTSPNVQDVEIHGERRRACIEESYDGAGRESHSRGRSRFYNRQDSTNLN